MEKMGLGVPFQIFCQAVFRVRMILVDPIHEKIAIRTPGTGLNGFIYHALVEVRKNI
jgi:hypothetical protein